jgi:hypothetical protein
MFRMRQPIATLARGRPVLRLTDDPCLIVSAQGVSLDRDTKPTTGIGS